MKFSSVREGSDHRLHVMTRQAEWFLDRIQKDTVQGMIENYRYHLKNIGPKGNYRKLSEIPRLCVGCELRQDVSGQPSFGAWNGLLALEVHELADDEGRAAVKRAAMQQPSTWAAMVGADDSCVVILVRVESASGLTPESEEDADRLLQAACRRLWPVYDVLLGRPVARTEPSVRSTILMPFDPHPLLNAEAVPFRIDATKAAADDIDAQHRLAEPEPERPYVEVALDTFKRHTRLYERAVSDVQRQLSDADYDDAEWWVRFITGVADQLCTFGLAEGEAAFHIWHRLAFRDEPGVTEELVRTLVAAVYTQVRATRQRRQPEPPITNLMHTLIRRINTHYVLRRNLIMGYAEYRPNNSWVVPWRPVTDEVVNTFTTDLQLWGLDVWDRDVRRYIYSTHVPAYDPVEEYLLSVNGKWDGTDHIGALARTVPTDIGKQWEAWFHTWFLGMVHQWRNRHTQFGNSVVPLLVSAQGKHKSTFCRNLLPPELRAWGYTDNLSLAEERPVHQAMAQMLLINLDEFNRISPKKQEGFLKNIIQLPTVKVKRPYGQHIEEVPRLASFIATTNMANVLTDPSGSRRFIGVNVIGSINVSRKPNYEQLYAQALAELDKKVRHWFNDAETAAIMEHNRQFLNLPSAFMFFSTYFEPATGKDGAWFTAAELLAEVKRKAGGALRDVPSLNAFGRYLNSMEGLEQKHTNNGNAYWVRELPLK